MRLWGKSKNNTMVGTQSCISYAKFITLRKLKYVLGSLKAKSLTLKGDLAFNTLYYVAPMKIGHLCFFVSSRIGLVHLSAILRNKDTRTLYHLQPSLRLYVHVNLHLHVSLPSHHHPLPCSYSQCR